MPPWWFIAVAVITFIAIGCVLGLMAAYVIYAHDEITQLRVQVCSYQYAAIEIIDELDARGLPVPEQFPISPAKGCNPPVIPAG